MDEVILTVAAIGAELTLEQQPNLPIEPDAVAADAAACEAAGAAIYHLHVRDSSGRPTMDPARFVEVSDAISSSCDLIVQFTTGGSVSDPPAARLAHLDVGPEMATITTGTVNFGDEVFMNDAPFVRDLYARLLERGVLPEFEIFDSGMLANALSLVGDEPGHHLHFDFVLGVPGAMPAWDDALPFLASKLPDGSTWSATGIGRAHPAVSERALEMGGHVRTGLEDVRYLEAGRPARSNAELIERVAAMARERGREPAGSQGARRALGLAAGGSTLPA